MHSITWFLFFCFYNDDNNAFLRSHLRWTNMNTFFSTSDSEEKEMIQIFYCVGYSTKLGRSYSTHTVAITLLST